MTAASHLWPARFGHQQVPSLFCMVTTDKAGYMAPGITFSTTHRDFTKTRVWYKMNTVFVVSISNNPYMRNLREFCLIPCQP
ncbi:hypothetical protein Y032_0453g1724 [Ancylostoma ceylanicum]|uniref:Uncharacterized protein n=1 Tax=Ancylostoma ceylanicum TaxID=53326 RepID=A0A016WYQ0_9BILA|nr:hypothetical protein Y032_0453g1724 [Ancylostoma ceylanicum]